MVSQQSLWPVLEEEIRSQGRISFRRFMELCLYHPQFGYYNTERVKLGAGGDYYTSAHVAPVFARILARHLERTWTALGRLARFDLVELGPGDGQLASQLLPWIEQRFPEFARSLRYTAVEQSAPLRGRLVESLQRVSNRVQIVADLPPVDTTGESREEKFHGCVFANEFFDALPVHLLIWYDGRWQERYVCLEGDRLAWCDEAPSSPELAAEAERRFDPALAFAEREDGWVAEVSPLAERWIEKVSRCLQSGQLLIIDYGYTLEEWQQGRFPQGSAMAYRKHQAIENLLANPGEQDLTAHINFTQLIKASEKFGFRRKSFQSQAKFLLELGEPDEFRDVFADCASEQERLRRAQLLKTLILPQGMGETFRVLQMEKAG